MATRGQVQVTCATLLTSSSDALSSLEGVDCRSRAAYDAAWVEDQDEIYLYLPSDPGPAAPPLKIAALGAAGYWVQRASGVGPQGPQGPPGPTGPGAIFGTDWAGDWFGPVLSGYSETLPAGAALPAQVSWYDGPGKAVLRLRLQITWQGAYPVQEVWSVYDLAGVLQQTVTDVVTYANGVESSRSRTVT